MDPNQNQPEDPNVPKPENVGNEPPSINTWQQNNENQTPAYNNTEYWNQGNTNNEPSNPVSETTSEAQTLETTTLNPDPQIPERFEPEVPTQTNDNQWSAPTSTSTETTTTEPVVTENPPTSPPKPKSSSNALMVLMIALVIILLGTTGLFAFQNYQLKQQAPKPTPIPVVSLEPTATPDLMANWKTHTDTKVGFSFKYPAGTVVEKFAQPEVGTPILIATGTKNFNSSTLPTCQTSKEPTCINEPVKEITLDGHNAISFGVIVNTGNLQSVLSVVQTTEAPLVEMAYSVDGMGNKEIFEQILSTFKFTSATPTASPVSTGGNCAAGYEKFTNANFSFCHPTGMSKAATSTDTSVVLENTTETLKVAQNFQGGWGGSPCLTINAVKVADYNSKRLSWKTEKADGTCDTTFDSFAVMINEGVFKSPFPYMIEYTKKSGTFADNTKFLAIEASFDPAN